MKHYFAVLALLCLAPASQSATLASWDFEGNVTSPTSVAAGLTASSVGSESGEIGFASGNSPTPGAAASLNGFLAGNRYEFTLTAQRGTTITISGLSFDDRASGTGPQSWSLFTNGNIVGSGATHNAFAASPMNNVPLSIKAVSDSITFWLVGESASSNSGTWRLDNLVVSGTVSPVPLPLPVTMLGAALIGLAGFRSRV